MILHLRSLLCATALALVVAVGAGAQEDGRPLPPGDVAVSPTPPPAHVETSRRAYRRGYLVLVIGGGVAAAFVVLALSGFFKQPGT